MRKVTNRESGIVTSLLPQILKTLYRRLSLTRGQLAVAAELYVMEEVDARGGDIAEAISNALNELGADYRVIVEEGVVRIDVRCETECISSEICPLPFYIAAYARKATSKRLSLVDHRVERKGECTIRYEKR